MSVYSRNCVVAAKLENGLTGGSGGVVTVAAHVSGAIPTGAATVTTPGTGYPGGKTIEVRFKIGANSTAIGRIVTNGSGAITAAYVDDGGSGYVHTVATAVTLEATNNGSYGIFTAPSAATDAVMVGSDFKLTPEVSKVELDMYTGSMGGKKTLPGEISVKLSFSIALTGSGNPVSEAAWAMFVRCLGASGALTSGTKWDYTPISDDFPSMSLYVWRGGWRHAIRGARVVKAEFSLGVGEYPSAVLTIIGIEQSRISTKNLPVPVLTSWRDPIVITDANTGDLRFGCTYNTSTGAFSGGSFYGSKGLKFTWDTGAKFRPFLGGSGVKITNREVTGSFSLDLEGVDNVAFYNQFKANTTTSLGFSVGNTAGSIFQVFFPAIELNDPGEEDDDGMLLTTYGFRARPTGYGLNDEVRVITR